MPRKYRQILDEMRYNESLLDASMIDILRFYTQQAALVLQDDLKDVEIKNPTLLKELVEAKFIEYEPFDGEIEVVLVDKSPGMLKKGIYLLFLTLLGKYQTQFNISIVSDNLSVRVYLWPLRIE